MAHAIESRCATMQCMTKEELVLTLPELQIDSEGRVWRVATRHGRGVKNGGGYESGTRETPCVRKRAEHRTPQGYLQLMLMVGGKRVIAMAHRVVWVRANGRPIPPGLTINHKNGRKDCNRPSNLELATMSEQRKHALSVLNVARTHPTGSNHPKTHLQESDVLRMRALRLAGVMVKEIAALYQMKPKAVSAICTRKTWKHI